MYQPTPHELGVRNEELGISVPPPFDIEVQGGGWHSSFLIPHSSFLIGWLGGRCGYTPPLEPNEL